MQGAGSVVHKRGHDGGKPAGAFASSAVAPRLHMRALEPRILLDAAAIETASDAVGEAVHSSLADAYLAEHFPGSTKAAEKIGDPYLDTDADTLFGDDQNDAASDQWTQIAFVAADVPDVLTLVSALPAEAEVVLLENNGDEMGQIAQALVGRTGIEAIHLISHGGQGILKLGSSEIDMASMTQTHREQLAAIGRALTEDGDILVYGCDFAEGDEGQEAVKLLAELADADVAASTDATGHSSLGGDWDLEFKSGTIEAEAINAGVGWLGLLPTTILESHEINLAEVDHDERIGSDRTVGQTFNHGSAGSQYEVSQIDVVLGLENNPPVQDITITIRESPNGPVLASGLARGTISSAGLTSTPGWQSITLDSPVTLDGGEDYVFMIDTDTSSSGGPGGERVVIAIEHDDFYSGGRAIDRDGETICTWIKYCTVASKTNTWICSTG